MSAILKRLQKRKLIKSSLYESFAGPCRSTDAEGRQAAVKPQPPLAPRQANSLPR